jgi:tetratricopeptide (TPR) repeat protein
MGGYSFASATSDLSLNLTTTGSHRPGLLRVTWEDNGSQPYDGLGALELVVGPWSSRVVQSFGNSFVSQLLTAELGQPFTFDLNARIMATAAAFDGRSGGFAKASVTLLATCRLALGQLEAALTLLEPLRSADPKNAGILYMLGVAYLKLKRTDEAHAVWTQMMESVSPAQANFLMGKAGYETGHFEEAAGYFRKTLAADPSFDGAHRELGKTLISLRDDTGARKELRQAAPDDSEAAYFLGALLVKAGDAGAIPLLIKAREENPDSWGASYYLGRIYLEQGRVKEALESLEFAAKARPDEAAVQYQLGRALRKSGREAEARAAFARVKRMKTTSLEKESEIVSPLQGPQ